MKSFYELLGADADDDGEALKKAFRKAVKAHHPDLHPGDPDAAERFRQIIAANAQLRDAKQRATYDRLLQLDRQEFQWTLERQHLRSQLARQQIRMKRMRATAAVAAVGALVGGYWLFSPMSTTTSTVAINKDDPSAAALTPDLATAKKDRHTATAIAAAERNEDAPATAAPKVDAVKGNAEDNVDNAGKPVETTGAHVVEPTDAPDQGEPRDQHEGTEVPYGASKPSPDKHEDAKVLDEANKLSADKHEDAKVLNEANKPSDDVGATMRFVTQRLRDGGDAQATAGRELALGPPANHASFYRERGIAAYGSGDFLGAIGNFDEAIQLNPNDAQSYNIRGNVWDELGILERALADYDEAIRIDPNNPGVFHDRAILWQRKGELDKALIDLDRAIRFSFSDVNMYCDRGLVWYEKGRHDRALADFNHATKLDPDSAAACIKRGLILHRNSEFKLALATVNQAIRVDPRIFDALRRANSPP
jgi:tetratricopeptide (TPR) repeat protein